MEKAYKKKKTILTIILILLYVLTAVVLNIMGFTFRSTPINYIMNYGFLVFMTVMVNIAMKRGFEKISIYTIQIDKLLKKIKEIEKNYKENENKEVKIKQDILNLEIQDILTQRRLKEQYENFINAYKAGNMTCNIENYMNFERLTEKLPIRFCEILPSLLTALGILGTFIGLIYGFMEFNYSNIEVSIEQFIAGVSVAFFTSVYGIALSSAMNYIGNEVEEGFDEKLISLESKFSFYQIFCREENIWKIMLEEMREINRNFGGTYKEGMKDSIVESFELGNKNLTRILKDWRMKQEKEINDLSKGIVTELKNTTTAELKETRDTVKNMNQLINVLSESIIELSNYTNDLMKEIRRFMEEIKITNDNVEEMNQSLEKKIQAYETQTMSSILRMETVGANMKKNVENVEQIAKLQSKNTRQLIAQGNGFSQFETNILQQQNEMVKEWDNVMDSFEKKSKQLERERKITGEIMQEQKQAIEKQSEVMNGYQKNLKEQFEEMIRLLNLKVVEISAKNSEKNVKAESEKIRSITERLKRNIEADDIGDKDEDLDEIVNQMKVFQLWKGTESHSDIEVKLEKQSRIIIEAIQEMLDQHTITGRIKKVFRGKN